VAQQTKREQELQTKYREALFRLEEARLGRSVVKNGSPGFDTGLGCLFLMWIRCRILGFLSNLSRPVW
jgi:hypothetical protein